MQAIEIKLNIVLYGKSEEKLKEFPDNFFDSVITDPPYEMDFMGKKWDSTGIAYNVDLWKEVLRVLKPGAYILVFGGTRTHHRVTCAIEDAGFIIKDEIDWIYGEGFPKSTNIGKQLDKEAGVEREAKPLVRCDGGQQYNKEGGGWKNTSQKYQDFPDAITELAKRWDGYGTGLKPAHEPIIVAMKPLEQGLTYAQNAKKWGVAGLNIDSGRIYTQDSLNGGGYDPQGKSKKNLSEASSYATKPIQMEFVQPSGRWPSNVILSHSPDCVCVGTKIINERAPEGGYTYNDREYKVKGFVKDCKPQAASNRGQETIEVWACVPDCPIRILDGQSGQTLSNFRKNKGNGDGTTSIFGASGGDTQGHYDSGGASRFFYCAKAKRSEKEAGLKGFIECAECGKFDSETHIITFNGEKRKEKCTRNNHPTVKPLDLMRYLINLIKMPLAKASAKALVNKQVILDPFCGSGTTLVALEQLGIDYIGIDSDSDNCLISIGRIGV